MTAQQSDKSDASKVAPSAEHERATWIAAAREGLADEALHIEKHGLTLARFRQA
ncbi:hypothetical protein PVT71_28685 (plasmid) [Salipiger sp. H15]|uniref:PH domain-containing protein n=1 Tax=Alloyangia sp. H15 TaxID=3029062 RepID=A0AAU8AVD1_9RHOB